VLVSKIWSEWLVLPQLPPSSKLGRLLLTYTQMNWTRRVELNHLCNALQARPWPFWHDVMVGVPCRYRAYYGGLSQRRPAT
jgi:hypothetical protein